MFCPECNSNITKLTEEGAYCIVCGFVFYGKLKGKNGLEVERQRIEIIESYLKDKNSLESISKISKDLNIPFSILEELIKEIMSKNEIPSNND